MIESHSSAERRSLILALACDNVLIISLHTVESADKVGCLTWKDEIIEETGGDWLLMHVRVGNLTIPQKF